MADVRLIQPAAGKHLSVFAAPGARLVLDFPADQATIERPAGTDSLVFRFDNDSYVEVCDFYRYGSGETPELEVDGHLVASSDFFSAFGPDLMPASGPSYIPYSSYTPYSTYSPYEMTFRSPEAPRDARYTEYDQADLLDGIQHLDGMDDDGRDVSTTAGSAYATRADGSLSGEETISWRPDVTGGTVSDSDTQDDQGAIPEDGIILGSSCAEPEEASEPLYAENGPDLTDAVPGGTEGADVFFYGGSYILDAGDGIDFLIGTGAVDALHAGEMGIVNIQDIDVALDVENTGISLTDIHELAEHLGISVDGGKVSVDLSDRYGWRVMEDSSDPTAETDAGQTGFVNLHSDDVNATVTIRNDVLTDDVASAVQKVLMSSGA